MSEKSKLIYFAHVRNQLRISKFMGILVEVLVEVLVDLYNFTLLQPSAAGAWGLYAFKVRRLLEIPFI